MKKQIEQSSQYRAPCVFLEGGMARNVPHGPYKPKNVDYTLLQVFMHLKPFDCLDSKPLTVFDTEYKYVTRCKWMSLDFNTFNLAKHIFARVIYYSRLALLTHHIVTWWVMAVWLRGRIVSH